MLSKLTPTLFFLLILSSCGDSDPSNPTEIMPNTSRTLPMEEPYDLLLAFYNVENLFDTLDNPNTRDDDFTPEGRLEWNSKKYYEKLDHIAEVLTNLKDGHLPDIVGMVEIENKHVVKQITEHRNLAIAGYQIAHYESRDQRGIDNALIYRPETYNVYQTNAINIDDYANGRLYSRDILHSEGHLPNGEVLHVFVNHWPSRRKGASETDYKRKAAAKALRAESEKILDADPTAKIIAIGDFNSYPDEPNVATVLGAGSPDNDQLLVNLALPLHHKGKGTVKYDEWDMFDQMIISHGLLNGNSSIKGDKMHIADDRFLMYKSREGLKPNRTYVGNKYVGGYSDHLPIFCEIVVSP